MGWHPTAAASSDRAARSPPPRWGCRAPQNLIDLTSVGSELPHKDGTGSSGGGVSPPITTPTPMHLVLKPESRACTSRSNCRRLLQLGRAASRTPLALVHAVPYPRSSDWVIGCSRCTTRQHAGSSGGSCTLMQRAASSVVRYALPCAPPTSAPAVWSIMARARPGSPAGNTKTIQDQPTSCTTATKLLG